MIIDWFVNSKIREDLDNDKDPEKDEGLYNNEDLDKDED